jgi:hypothetical protein
MRPATRPRPPGARLSRRHHRTAPEPLEQRVLLAVIYVDDTAAGPARDGTTWATAYVDLQAALAAAAATPGGDEVQVAAGTYRPSARTDAADPRSATFQLANGVRLLGGYPNGGGTARNPSANVTTLSGDLGARGDADDNAYHVLTATDVDATAVLDGFTVTAGNATDGFNGGGLTASSASPTLTACVFTANRSNGPGGGLANDHGSSPRITGCTFSDNFGGGGGGGLVNLDNSNPVLTDCSFTGNHGFDGGGMWNNASSPTLTRCAFTNNPQGVGMLNTSASPTLTDCTFTRNEYGGMSNFTSSPTLLRCTFTANHNVGVGGAMFNMASYPALTACVFEANSCSNGGAMFNTEGSSPKLADCAFRDNLADNGAGGAMWNQAGAAPVLTGCTFSNNVAVAGGAVYNLAQTAATFDRCTFTGNVASEGGAIHSAAETLSFTDCTFARNRALGRGGALRIDAGFPVAARCTFLENGADTGGAVYVEDGAARVIVNEAFLVNSAFVANTASAFGGALYNARLAGHVVNCTFVANSAGTAGGAAYSADADPAGALLNCVFWANAAPSGAAVADGSDRLTDVRNSVIQGSHAGPGNFDSNPLFVRDPSSGADGRWGTASQPSADDDFGDLRLRPGSPAADAGDTAALPTGTATDLGGQPRVQGGAVDAGAYEQAAGAGLFEGHRYRVMAPGAATGWADAQAAARAAGGNLVAVNSAAEQAFLEQLLTAAGVQTGSYWTGGTRTSSGPLTFGWTTGEPFSFTHWGSGEPDQAGDEPAVAVRWTRGAAEPDYARRGTWDDQPERGFGAGGTPPPHADLAQRGYVIETGTAAVPGDAEVFNGHTYALIGRDGITWADAAAQARQMGGHLVTISYPGEDDFVTAFVRRLTGRNQEAWIGFTDDAATGGHEAGNTSASPYPPAGNRGEGWVWEGGEPVAYQNWAAAQPDNAGGQNFALINAPGAAAGTWADERPLASGASGPRAAVVEIPSGPTAPPYEAEQAAVVGALVASDHPGFSGPGFVDFLHAEGDSVAFTVNATAGWYDLAFRYANGGAARRMALWLNGAALPGGVDFAPTGSWDNWSEAVVRVALPAGQSTIQLQATGQSGPNLDALTLRPAEAPPPATYQAESAALAGPLAMSNARGFTGTGFADYQHRSGDSVEFAINVPAAGAYDLDFRYANGSASDRPLDLRVDGQVVGRVSFGSSGNWNTWRSVTQSVLLSAGRHAVRLTSAGSNGPNLDALTVTASPAPPPAEPLTLQAESASLAGPVAASNVPGYTGTGFADYVHAKGDSVEFTFDVPSAGRYALDFRYANGSSSDRPLDLAVNGTVVQPRLSFAPGGAWSAWRTTGATVSLLAGRNTVRLTATGGSGPNLDAMTVRGVV